MTNIALRFLCYTTTFCNEDFLDLYIGRKSHFPTLLVRKLNKIYKVSAIDSYYN